MNVVLKPKLANHKISMRYGLFKKLTETILYFSENVVFIITKDKFCISQMDEDRFALIEMEFNKNNYTAIINYSEIDELVIAIDYKTIEELNEKFKSEIYDNKTIEIIVTETYENMTSKAIIQLPDVNYVKEVEECEMARILPAPILECDTSITLSTIHLKAKLEGIMKNEMFIVATPHNTVTLKHDPKRTVLRNTENTLILYNVDCDDGLLDPEILPIMKWNSMPIKTEACYNKEYVEKAIDLVMNEFDEITLSFSEDMPLLLEHESEECALRFYLAPKIVT